MTSINDNTVLVRGLDVTARIAKAVTELSDRAEGGVLLETLMGRYVLDRDARVVWLLIDGDRSVGELLDGVAETSGLPLDQIRQPTYDLCERLLEFGLVEVVTPADALTSR
ncbi:PqqD family protein [Micromonospora cathayae]|uniref:PqqD family peptide modification chaperone n=1 Tax=Micromonospora cathayae TaxID=3028804 RepID=A0ABY7ZTU8_9ACTN|nr:PqqD family protein [Micromonospora sp. HUAS 3]WDZ86236.1 PqqD family peptide modification chaperone [Micromonospora sp. HUAS 3]